MSDSAESTDVFVRLAQLRSQMSSVGYHRRRALLETQPNNVLLVLGLVVGVIQLHEVPSFKRTTLLDTLAERWPREAER